jgi:lipoyl-dependent peroxiredoxin
LPPWEGQAIANNGSGTIAADRFATPIAIPPDLGGSGKGSDPKTLLVASAAACYSMTLVGILQSRKLPLQRLTMETKASDARESGFAMEHRLHVTLLSGATTEQLAAVQMAFAAADRACAVGNMLKKADVRISVEGSVAAAEALHA